MAEEKKRKYNDEESLNELCSKFLTSLDGDDGAAIGYCKDFLKVLSKKDFKAGAVLSYRSKPR
ncbi:MAG TPA: hypothetical protein VMW71_07315 [Thermoplasmata archaeon]|nr:hypothetical protein [Thermoplasmata archaeon]